MALVSGQNGTFRRTEKWRLVLPEAEAKAKESCGGQGWPCPSKHSASGGGGPWACRSMASPVCHPHCGHSARSWWPSRLICKPVGLQGIVRSPNSTYSHDSPAASEQPRGSASPKRRQLVSWRQDCHPRLSFSWWCAGPACPCSWELTVHISSQLHCVQ